MASDGGYDKTLTVTFTIAGVIVACVSKTVKVPDPVYERIARRAEREDVAHGTVVRDWMDKAEKFEQMEGRY